jgi:hypothetical protein
MRRRRRAERFELLSVRSCATVGIDVDEALPYRCNVHVMG